MADDLMDFSEFDANYNDENVDPEVELAPKLMHTPVVKHSILKQSTKDNLIQLFTPVQKNKKLKVHFTPLVQSANTSTELTPTADGDTSKENNELNKTLEDEEKENWEERTSVLTKQDHQDYCQYAEEFLLEVIAKLPIKEEDPSTDSGIDESMMDVQETTDIAIQPPAGDDESECVDVLSEAENLLNMLRAQTGVTADFSENVRVEIQSSNEHVLEATTEYEDEPMDIDVSMIQPQEKIVTPEKVHSLTDQDNKQNEQPAAASEVLKNNVEPAVESVNSEKTIEQNTLVKETDNESIEDSKSIDSKNETETRNDSLDRNAPDGGADIQIREAKTNGIEISEDTQKENSDETPAFNKDHANNLGEGQEIIPSDKTDISNGAEANDKKTGLKKEKGENVGKMDDDHSSDEEFLSADEDMVSSQTEKPNQTESPGRTPPKVGYNLNFSDLDSLDPFQTKTCIQNSPDLTGKGTTKVKNLDCGKQNKKTVSETCTELSHIESGSASSEANKAQAQSHTDEVENLTEESSAENFNSGIEKPTDQKMSVNNESETPAKKVAEDTVSKTQEKAQEVFEETARSPPLPQRGAYNLDDLENIDPFTSRGQIMNSPGINQNESKQANDDDPFKPRKQIMNSPVPGRADSKQEQSENLKEGTSITEESQENAAEVSESSSDKLEKRKTLEHKEKSEIILPENADDVDPFKSNNKIMNSPTLKSSSYEPLPDDLDSLDPFKPKNQMMSSPPAHEKCQNDIKKEPKKDEKMKISKMSKSNPANVQENLDDIDPFKPTKQVMNSPATKVVPENLEDIDPFKPQKQIMNTPDRVAGSCGLLDNFDNIDPFKPNTQIMNSPVQNTNVDKIDLVKSQDECSGNLEVTLQNDGSKEQSLPNILDDIDPFKPKKQIANSPEKGLPITDLPENFGDIDPFKPRKQITNSPLTSQISDDTDPFKPKNQVMNSPDLKMKSNDSLVNLEDIDPFKPRNQMKSSPVTKDLEMTEKNENTDTIEVNSVFDDIDPFKPKSQIQNSPKPADDENFDSIDPFKPRNQMMNSPVRRGLDPGCRSALTPKTVLSPFINKTRLPATPEESFGADGEVIEVQGVTRRGQTGNTNPQGFDIDDSEFVAASEVFKDPGVWEMLEQFGSNASNPTQESALSRMSLYVKFDPLVEGSRMSTNPRRISIKPKQLEKVKEYGLDETLLLLGTPPKKKRQSMNVSQLRHTPLTSKLALSDEGMKRQELNMGQGAVDLIMALSPDESTTTTTKNPSHPSSLLSGLDDENTGAGIFEELKYTDSDLRQLRNDVKLEFQGQLIVKEKEWFGEKKQYEKKLKDTQAVLEAEKKQTQEMAKACLMFEETIQKLQAIQEKDKAQISSLNKEKQQMSEDIQGVENAFSDLHRRYEKLKTVVEGNLKNEEILKKYASDIVEKLKKSEEKYSTLKKTAEEKISKSTQEIAKLKDEISADQSKHEAAKKMMTMKIESLERQLQQKIEENKNLTEICDQLISKAEK